MADPSFQADSELVFGGKRVYVFGSGRRPILLMHELPGLTRQCICLARALAARGFTVYVPLLFGRFDHRAVFSNVVALIWSGKWRPFRNETPPIAGFLRTLADHIHGKHPAAQLGAIGMCLTGHLALALLDREYVNAAVVCQPSLPLLKKGVTGLSPDDVATVTARGVPFLFFRFKTDTTCPPERLDAFLRTFPTLIDPENLPASHPKAHAALTVELFDDRCTMKDDPSARLAFDKTLRYLDDRLR